MSGYECKCLYVLCISFITMNMRKKRRNIDNSLDILKMEYQSCRNKIDDLDNLLKDLRFKGITIVTGFIAGNGLLLKLEYLDVTIVVSFFTIMLILQVWGYDHKYNMFLVGTVERAQEIEDRLQEMISDIREWYSFSIDRDAQLEDEFDKEIISKKLEDEFKTKKEIILSRNASLEKEKDNKWKITDGGEIYIIKKEDEKLNIYREVKMLSHKLSDVYRKLPGHIAITSSFLYTLLGFTGLGILLYSTYLKEIPWLSVLIMFISIVYIFLMLYMWYLRNKAESWFKWPALPRFKRNNKKS